MMNWKTMFAMLAGSVAWASPIAQNRHSFFGLRRPTGSALRNPADPVQARRIEAAAAKRAGRACKLHNIHARGSVNHAHLINYEFSAQGRLLAYEMPARLNPTYVNK